MVNSSIKITGHKGRTKKIPCLGCAIQKGEVEPPGGSITTSKYFNAHQDYEIPIPGFIIISSRRHIQSIDEFTDNEQQDFIKFLCHMRSALRQVLGVKTVYLIQKEDTPHHFHIWLFPRQDWMKKKFGRKIASVSLVAEFAKKKLNTKKNLTKVNEAKRKLKKFFINNK